MKLTCTQMDILISFYLEDELSAALKRQVEEHLKACPVCHAKYDIIETMLEDLKCSLEMNEPLPANIEDFKPRTSSEQYKIFKTNLSAYIDNELTNSENIKIKKFAINNKAARKELEDSYNIKKLMSDSFKKAKENAKCDFTRSTLRKLELDEEASLNFHPAIRFLIAFTISILVLGTIVLVSLSV